MIAAKAATSPKLGNGSVLQVVSQDKTTAFSTTSNSFVDVTGLSVSITPSSSSNKILVFGNYHWWMQDNDNQNSFHGRQYLQREIGGNDSWADIRSASTATFENSNLSAYLNNRGELTCLNAIYTHGQSAGSSIKVRIVHRSVQPSSVDLLVFQRNSNETNLTIMEIAG